MGLRRDVLHVRLSPSARPPRVVIRRGGCGNVVVYLCPDRMRPGQCSSEIDAAAGDLCADRVSMSQRSGDCDRRGAEPSDGSNDCGFRVCATVDRDGLAVAKTDYAGNRYYGGAYIGGGA